MTIIEWRYQHLIQVLQAQARTTAEARRLTELVELLSAALPAERVAAAYRAVKAAA